MVVMTTLLVQHIKPVYLRSADISDDLKLQHGSSNIVGIEEPFRLNVLDKTDHSRHLGNNFQTHSNSLTM